MTKKKAEKKKSQSLKSSGTLRNEVSGAQKRKGVSGELEATPQTKEPNEEDQSKFLQLQMLDQQMRQIQQYIQTFDQQLLEIRSVIDSLKELSKLKKGDLILAPIASGIFIKAKLEDNKDVRVNVGENTVVTKTIEQAIKMLEGQEKEINQYRSETLVKFDEMIKKAESLQK